MASTAPSTDDRIDMDSEDEYDLPKGQPAANMSERRREQKAIFETWLFSDAGREALKSKTKEAQSSDAADEQLSIQSLLAKESFKIISSAREYQQELFERAKKENTIAVLDTGSGKTLIAVLLLRWIIDQELEDRAAGKQHRLSFFLVPSVQLTFQQFAVLETNLDHKISRICGADNADHTDKKKWAKLCSESKVIVCTADILHYCLAHSYITMRQINLMIFDEAHHAKKNHAYARIIKDFYVSDLELETRPRVFGMTASPIDAKTDVTQAATELEAILDSKIATTQDMSLTNSVNRPTEQILRYARLFEGPETKLLQAIKAKFSHVAMFQRFFNKFPIIARELGSWCADQFLLYRFSEKKLGKYEKSVEQKFHARSNRKTILELDNIQAELRSAFDFVQEESPNLMVSAVDEASLSSKVIELQKFLSYQFERPTDQRCLVFVDQRDTARLLSALFQKIGSQNMHCAFLIGADSDWDEDSFSFRQQVMTLIKFRKGELNCLFSTSVAEEGLDIPDCNLIIRFDMYKTMIQYVQSRGRARQRNSKFIHMIEMGNSIHQERVTQIRYDELRMRKFCEALPDDRRLVANEDTLELLLSKEKGTRVYREPSTGAKLTYGNSLGCLATFVSAIPNETDEILHPAYIVSPRGSKFICEVLLPGIGPLPLRSAIGRVCSRKSLAKRSAAFEACIKLRELQYINEHLLPIYEKKLPAMRNALLAVNTKKTNQYTMRTKPSVWEQGRDGTLPTELWVTIVDFPDGLEDKHQPLALLTRTRLPDFPTFPIFLNDARAAKVVSITLHEKLRVDEKAIQKLSTFTFRIFQDVFSKKYQEDPSQLSYWLAPSLSSVPQDPKASPEELIDWALLDEVFENEEYPWSAQTSDEALLDRFLVDRWDGSRKFYSLSIDKTLKPLDPVPEGTAKHKWKEDILGYSVSLWKTARARAVWDPNQAVVLAKKIQTRRNVLAAPDPKEMDQITKAYLCLEPLKISALTPAVAASCFVWPGIIHKFESCMIAVEACEMIGVECEPSIALAAVTKDSDNSGDHGQERINFQQGMGDNYERLEFIGDTYLKTATTVSTFIQNPNDNEFDFHVKRMRLLCNKNLFNVAVELKLYEYIRSTAFSRRIWYPEGLTLLEGKGAKNQSEPVTVKHALGDKTIADVCEALIGAAFLSHDRPGEAWKEDLWDNAVFAVAKLTTSTTTSEDDMPVHGMTKWSDYRATYEKPEYQTADSTASQRDLAEKVELEHAYRFKYPRLLRAAFMHPSMPQMHERLPSYERLEFLGDALLDMASITHIFYRFPDKDPQWLTEHKMALVSNKFLGAVCVNIGFHKHLRHSSAILENQVREYATELLEAKRTAGDSRDYWTTVSDPPKCLPDIVESFVGAMFIDADFDYSVVQDFFDKHIKWYFEDMSIYDTFANKHPCTHLHNLLQTTYGCQDYRLIAQELPPADGIELDRKDVVAAVMIHDHIVAYSKGKSGRYARVRAANNAIEVIEGLAPFEFRRRFGCECSLKGECGGADGVVTETLSADCGV